MKIGNVVLKNNLFLAPMAGVTDMPFRRLCVENGCGLVYTEMVSAKGMFYNDEKTKKLTYIHESEKPVAIQIFGSEPYIMEKCADELNKSDAAIIDINMGCPTPKITKNGDGSALMLEPDKIGEIVRSVVKASDKPVTVKIRKGWDDNNINAVEVAKIIEQNGANAVAVHGRTRQEFYSGKADWDIIRRVKEAVGIPVIGNGDVVDYESMSELLSSAGCDAIMVGRGAQGNPWIFRQLLNGINRPGDCFRVSNEERHNTIIRHLEMMTDYVGEGKGVVEMRKHIAWYVKGLKNAASAKNTIFKATQKNQVIEILNEYFESKCYN